VPGRGCDWTLGGLIGFSRLIVITPNGGRHPRFEPATPEEAQAHYRASLAERVPVEITIPVFSGGE
jgi:hypothetical protein